MSQVRRPQDLDCMSNSCQFGGRAKGGMRVNGPCRCVEKLLSDLFALEAETRWAVTSLMHSIRSRLMDQCPITDLKEMLECVDAELARDPDYQRAVAWLQAHPEE